MNLRRLKRSLAHTEEIIALQETLAAEHMAEIRAARENARLLLGSHGLYMASACIRITPVYLSHDEFRAMVNDMRAGGYHRVREINEREGGE